MCIICVHKSGSRLPTKTELANCFNSNRDGAGLMYVRDGNVIIQKGFLTLKAFKKAYKAAKLKIEDNFVLHCRIGTQGHNNASNCHPFPLSSSVDDLKETHIITDIGMAHNGILWSSKDEDDISDTMEAVRDMLSVSFVRDNLKHNVMNLFVSEWAGASNKFAFLHNDGEIVTIGNFIEEDGLLFSNSGFRRSYVVRTTTTKTSYGKNDDLEKEYDENWYHHYHNNHRNTKQCDFCGYGAYNGKEIEANGYVYTMCSLCESANYVESATKKCGMCEKRYHHSCVKLDSIDNVEKCPICSDISDAEYFAKAANPGIELIESGTETCDHCGIWEEDEERQIDGTCYECMGVDGITAEEIIRRAN